MKFHVSDAQMRGHTNEFETLGVTTEFIKSQKCFDFPISKIKAYQ